MTPADDTLLSELAALQRRHWPAEVPLVPTWPFGEIALSDYLRRWAETTPAKPAIVFYGTEISYRELDDASDRVAALLAGCGVRAGDRVAVMLGNCPQFAFVFFGILKLGAVHVPVNPLFRDIEMVYELNDSGATVLVVLDQLAEMAARVLPQTSVMTTFFTSFHDLLPAEPTFPIPPSVLAPRIVPPGMTDLMPAIRACTDPAPAVAADLDAVAALNYTGGTTGMPKGCVHTQRDMVYTAATTCTVPNTMSADDVLLNYMPLFWIAGEDMGLIFPVFTGSTVVTLARWDALGAILAIERYRVTRASMVVDNAVEVMEHPDVERHSLRSLTATRVSSFVKKLNPAYRARWLALTGTVMIEAASSRPACRTTTST